MDEMAERLAHLSPEERRVLLAQLLRQQLQEPQQAPLSLAQERLWLFEQVTPGTTGDLMATLRFSHSLNLPALKQSLDEVVRRHEALRTTFTVTNTRPVQLIAPPSALTLPLIDLSHITADRRETEARRLADVEARAVSDLTKGPLFRANLIRLSNEEHLLFLNIHHSLSDGWSMGILLNEVLTLYAAFSKGNASPLPEPPLQYADWARWQRDQLQGETHEAQQAYWKHQLKDAPAILDLSTDRSHLSTSTFHGARQPLEISQTVTEALKALAQQEESTLFMIVLAAFQALLARLCNQDDISVGTLISNRDRSELAGLIGLLIEPVILRTRLSGNPTFRNLVKQVRQVTLDAYAHRELAFEELLQELQPVRQGSWPPLFQVMLVFQDMPKINHDDGSLTVSIQHLEGEGFANSDLALFVWETSTGLAGSMEYNADLFDQTIINRLLSRLQVMLESIARQPEQRLSELPLLTNAEQDQLLKQWSHPGQDYAQDGCVPDLFRQQAMRTPSKMCAVKDKDKLTFQQVEEQSNQLAYLLRKLSQRESMYLPVPDHLVGLLLDPGPFSVIGMLGILKVGYGFVPLDPEYPPERMAFILADCGIKTLVTETKHLPLAHCLTDRNLGLQNIVCLDLVAATPKNELTAIGVYDSQDWARESRNAPMFPIEKEELVYVVYTSGSTGTPKGVPITHRNLAPTLFWAQAYLQLGEHTKTLQNLSLCFDFGIFEVLTTLVFGGTLHFLDKAQLTDIADYACYMNDHDINTMHTTPSFFKLLLAGGIRFETLRVLLLGGEELTHTALDEILASLSGRCIVYNGYGPTESTICSSIFEVGDRSSHVCGDFTRTPIGQAAANHRLYVLDSYQQLVPIGIPGELHVGGMGVARGYYHRPELTASQFIPDLFSAEPGGRLYKTGDLVRYLPDGNLEFLGRLDHQVKLHGFRIELGEIESVLNQIPAVFAAVVVVRQDTPGEKQLVAYVVPRQGESLNSEQLLFKLHEQLPTHMVPSAFVFLDALPLTLSGKVNRKELSAPKNIESKRAANLSLPESAVEKKVAEIWSQVLKIEPIDIYDNFFDLGGHSLKAVQVIYRLNQAFSVKLPLRSLFQEPTIADLALFIEETLIDSLVEKRKQQPDEAASVVNSTID